jgi:hypothetical protein
LSARSRIAFMLAATMSNACHSFGAKPPLVLAHDQARRGDAP